MVAILIYFWLFLAGNFVSAVPTAVDVDQAQWTISSTQEYKPFLHETHFCYKVTTFRVNKVQVKEFLIEVPSCPEIVVVPSDKRTQHPYTRVRGFRFASDIGTGSSRTYCLKLAGLVKTSRVRYVIDGLKRRSFNDQRLIEEYSLGEINGPKCEQIPTTVCDCGQERYVGVCYGNTVRVPLQSKSRFYERLQWNTDYPGCSFSNRETESPYITFHGPVCDVEFELTLTVWGPGHQVIDCVTHVTAIDVTPPTFSGIYGPVDVTVPCDDIPSPLQLVAKDECDNDVDVTRVDSLSEGLHETYIVRTWTAVDDCDNKATFTQTVVVRDNEDPRLIGVPDDTEVQCNEAVQPCVVTALDNCEKDLTVDFTENVVGGSCVDSWTIFRTWSVSDNSYNSVTETQTVKVVDVTPPVLYGIPDDVTVDCDQVPDDIFPSATDNCMEDVEVSHSEYRIPGSCPSEYTIVHTFTAKDECGNKVSKTWNIHVKDDESPRMSDLQGASYDATVPCDDIPVPCVVEAVDNCAEYPRALEAEVKKIEVLCEGNYTLLYTWHIEDECGNQNSREKRIIVRDEEKPRFSLKVPEVLRTDCEHHPFPEIKAFDDCGDATVNSPEDSKNPGNGYTIPCDFDYEIIRIWIATDSCGLTATMKQTVIVTDKLKPLLVGVPPDMTIPCDTDTDFSTIPVTAVDNCDCVGDIAYSYTIPPDLWICEHSYTKVNKWKVKDCCGHAAEAVQTVTIYDKTPPSITGISGNHYVPTEDLLTFPFPEVTVDDNCDDSVMVTSSQKKVPGTCPHNFMVIREWFSEDTCGNKATALQSLYCDDVTPPTFVTENYNSYFPCPEPSVLPVIEVTDNVDAYLNEMTEETTTVKGTCPESYSIIRKMTVTDPCGNFAKKTYTVYIDDTVPPEFDKVPYQVEKYITMSTLEAYSMKQDETINAIDLCAGPLQVNFKKDEKPGTCETEYTIYKKWWVTDPCGNYNEITRTIDVIDESPPELWNVPEDTTLDCTVDIGPGSYKEPTASDYGYSGAVPVLLVLPTITIRECENNVTIIKCWKAIDCVGHSVQKCQTIKVYDQEPPVFGYRPSDTTVECDEIPPIYVAEATDDCTPNIVVRSFERKIDGTCNHDYILVRSWTAKDVCDNEVSMVQTITVYDMRDPRWTFVPNHLTANCDEFVPIKNAICEDDCDYGTTPSRSIQRNNGTCEDSYLDVRTWTCHDGCGNSITASQTIVFEDVTPPNLLFVPHHRTIPCTFGGTVLPEVPYVKANDNCDTDVQVHYRTWQLSGGYGNQSGVTVREWIAEDNCGNTDTGLQSITVVDNIPPAVTIPSSYAINCTEVEVVPDYITVFDNCDPNPKVDKVMNNIGTYPCHHAWVHEYCFTPYDKSGNYGIQRCMRINSEDVTPPNWGPLPDPFYTVEHDESYGPASLYAIDECDGLLNATWSEVVTPGSCELEKTVIYTYTASDWCDNTIVWKQTIKVIDTIAPVLSPKPGNVTLDCPSEIPAVPVVTAFDVYDNTHYEVEFFESQELTVDCEDHQIIYRRWVVRDCTGNSDSWTQTVTIKDDTDPWFPVTPEDTTVECDPDDYQALIALDDCDLHVDVEFTSTAFSIDIYGAECGYKIARRWVARDNCGNEFTIYQTITVLDTIDPYVIGDPEDVIVDNHNIPKFYDLSCSDNCRVGVTTAVYNETIVNGSCPEEFTITRRWCCYDDCKNEKCVTQVVDVQDNGLPEIAWCPADITVQSIAVPPPPTITAIDNQVYHDIPVVYDFTNETHYQQEIMYTIWRRWSATDNCGNAAYCYQTVVVIDTIPPVIPDVPRDTYLDCDDIILKDPALWNEAYANISAILQQSIADVESVTISPPPEGPFAQLVDVKYDITCKGEYKFKRTWTATDHAGNSLSDTQIITVVDNHAPIFTNTYTPTLREVCGHDEAVPAKVYDNCDWYVYPIYKETKVPGYCPYDYRLDRIWTVRDDCGNHATKVQTVYVEDDGPPVFTTNPPDDVTVNCTQYENLPFAPKQYCNDECDGQIEAKLTISKSQLSCPNNWLIIRTWVCADSCKNLVYKYQTITIEDNTPPVFLGDYVGHTEINCDDPVPVPVVIAEDDCTDNVEVHSETIGYTLNYESMRFTQKWTTWDECGNRANKSREVTIVDPTPPVITPKTPNMRIPCEDMYEFTLPEAKCSDNCGTPFLTKNVVTIDGSCDKEYEVIVTWNCEDLHSLTDSHTFTITVYDNEKPTISQYHRATTYECHDIPSQQILLASDNCDDVSIVMSEEKEWPDYIQGSVGYPIVDWNQQSMNGEFFFVPTYYYIDISSSHYHYFEKYDDKQKIGAASCLMFVKFISQEIGGFQYFENTCYFYSRDVICEVQKEAYKMPITQSKVTESKPTEWYIHDLGRCEFVPEPPHLCDDYDLIRTWTAEDNCGNKAVKVNTITIRDLHPPVFYNIPEDRYHDCLENNTYTPIVSSNDFESALHGIQAPYARDDCDSDVEIEESHKVIEKICDWTYKTVYTWVATDDCGHKATATMTVTKTDSTPPEITYVPDIDYECDDFVEPQSPPVTDDCGEVSVTKTDHRHLGTCTYFIQYTWRAEDECGNVASKIQKISVDDSEPPTLSGVPQSETVDCNHAYPNVMPSCHDNCTSCTVTEHAVTVPIHCGTLYTVNYVATDECGNSVSDQYSLTKLDTTPPTFHDLPEDSTVDCEWPYSHHGVTVSDDCGKAYLRYEEEKTYLTCQDGVIQVVYLKFTATDECGHHSTHTSLIHIVDNTPPTLSMTQNVYDIPCDAELPVVNAIANDNCGEVTLTRKTWTMPGSCIDEYTVVVEFTAVDPCGNTIVSQHITNVTDSGVPTLNPKPKDIVVDCDQIPDPVHVEASDDCADNKIIFNEYSNRDGYSTTTYDIIRCWVVKDNCGNEDSWCQTITVEDNEAPKLTCNGQDECEDYLAECDVYPGLPLVEVSDNCYEHLEINYTTTPIPGTCIYDHIEIRRWTTDDSNGQFDELVQTVTYSDNQAPTLIGYREDATVECPDHSDKPVVTASDNCDYELTVDVIESPVNESTCPNVFTHWWKWTATDLCGNADWFERTVTIVDTKPPTFSFYPDDAKVECDNIASSWPGDITAIDDCDYHVSVKFTETKTPLTCPDSFFLIRFWSTEDCTGNTASITQTVFVDDNIPPWFVPGVVPDITVDQDAAYSGSFQFSNPYEITAEDNCADPSVAFTEYTLPIQYDCDYMYYRIRQWSIHDDCSNEEVMTQTIDMVRTKAAELETPEDVTVECDSIPEPCDVKAKGTNTYDATITFSEWTIAGSCPGEYKLLRTWTLVDCADNQNAHTQTIYVQDNDPPVLTRYPENAIVECDCDSLTGIPEIDAVDNCDLSGDDVLLDVTRVNGTCIHEYTLVRDWSVTDSCGNTESHSQTLNVEDNSAPIWCEEYCDEEFIDTYKTLECDQYVDIVSPTAKDDCDPDPTVMGEEPELDLVTPCETHTIYQWDVVDKCGNYASCSRTLIKQDTTPPFCVSCPMYCVPLHGYGDRLTGYVRYSLQQIMPDVDDNCDPDFTVQIFGCNSTISSSTEYDDTCYYFPQMQDLYIKLSFSQGETSGRYYYVWFEVEDACGNKDLIHKSLWVPAEIYQYDDAVDAGLCLDGLGSENIVPNLPTVMTAED